MSRQRLRELVADLREDTGWEAFVDAPGEATVIGGDGDAIARVYGGGAHLATPEARAAFIAEARRDVPLLLTVASTATRYLSVSPPDKGHPRAVIEEAADALHRALMALETP